MTPKQLLDAGDLAGAIEQLGVELKAHPADTHRRTFLFELLCFAGDHGRAERQLDVIAHQSDSAEIGVLVYRAVLGAERARARVFAEGAVPAFLAEPPGYAAFHLEAIDQLRQGRPAAASTLLAQAEASRPRVAGTIDGRSFADVRDSDDRFGPFLEVIQADRYCWVPFEQIAKLEISPPKMLRDLLWATARLECRHGSRGEVLLPVLYPDTARHSDPRTRLGRMTDWVDAGEGVALGVGQRLLVIDDQDHPLLEVRTLELAEA